MTEYAEIKQGAIEKRPANQVEQRQPTELAPSPPQTIQPKKFKDGFGAEIAELVSQAGTVQIDDRQKEILFSPVHEEDIEIRPDGLIYLPWMEYVCRLRDAFGLKWTLIPEGEPRFGADRDRSSVLWGFWMIIDGKPYGFAIGEQEYQPTNKKMTWSDACEGAKSNALMRLCKGLGISLELWRPSFVRAWKEKYAYSEWITIYGNKRLVWKKKEGEEPDVEPEEGEVQEVEAKPPTEAKKPRGRPKTVKKDASPAPVPEDRAPVKEPAKQTPVESVKGQEQMATDELQKEIRDLLNTLIDNYKRDPGRLLEGISARLMSDFKVVRGKIPEDLSQLEAIAIRNALIATVKKEEALMASAEQKTEEL